MLASKPSRQTLPFVLRSPRNLASFRRRFARRVHAEPMLGGAVRTRQFETSHLRVSPQRAGPKTWTLVRRTGGMPQSQLSRTGLSTNPPAWMRRGIRNGRSQALQDSAYIPNIAPWLTRKHVRGGIGSVPTLRHSHGIVLRRFCAGHEEQDVLIASAPRTVERHTR